jgi:tetratricopeptide (TPR) repeat protein
MRRSRSKEPTGAADGSAELNSALAAIDQAARSTPEAALEPKAVAEVCVSLARASTEAGSHRALREAHADRVEVALGLADWSFSFRFKSPRRMLELARTANQVAGALSPRVAPPRLIADARAEALLSLANALKVNNRFHAAGRALQQAEWLIRAGSGNPFLGAKSDRDRASLLGHLHRKRASLELFQRAQRRYEEIGASSSSAFLSLAVARQHAVLGELDEALLWARQALVARLADRELTVVGLSIVAGVLSDAGRPEDAVEVYREAHALYDFRPDDLLFIRSIALKGRLCARLGYLKEACAAMDAARQAFLNAGRTADYACTGLELAALYGIQGQRLRMVGLAAESLAIFNALGIYRGVMLPALLAQRARVLMPV